ncbi:hypothetical protein MPLDJ20_110484 [Mesorhizobium plurifarium]|uniref:Uncharacterized protein n=1 Tax=Mesorhizobium plurifarium TaxID=69974 RepID=A0A090FVM9_MESPL|nr:hypothetical protein MPLDJ20_110484 [Mesorhizobium plurifarium]
MACLFRCYDFKSNFTERTAWLERRRVVLPARFA